MKAPAVDPVIYGRLWHLLGASDSARLQITTQRSNLVPDAMFYSGLYWNSRHQEPARATVGVVRGDTLEITRPEDLVRLSRYLPEQCADDPNSAAGKVRTC